jgi:hypothetical protein
MTCQKHHFPLPGPCNVCGKDDHPEIVYPPYPSPPPVSDEAASMSQKLPNICDTDKESILKTLDEIDALTDEGERLQKSFDQGITHERRSGK